MSKVLYDVRDNVARITINRPEAMNAMDPEVYAELSKAWIDVRDNPDVWVAIVTGAGERAFTAGADLKTMIPRARERADFFLTQSNMILNRGLEVWKPVIAAVNGMACGGAFYMLGEVEFIIAAEHATFFDPHVTYGMTAAFEPIHMHDRMPFGDIMRLSLLGNYERLSAQRAFDTGLVSEVVPKEQLHDAAAWAANAIAAQPPLAIEGTLRAIWAARELSNRQAVAMAYAYVAMGTNQDSIAEGQKMFESGKRVDWKLR